MSFFKILSFLICLHSVSFASVSSNPFLRPGSQEKPPPPPPTTAPPAPKGKAEQEVEFRGYYILNGEPFFCIFNKKTGHAEWLSVAESTYDSYRIERFDKDSEKLTVSYEGQSFDLSLIDSASGTPGGGKNSSAPTKVSQATSSSQRTIPRVMPPRPKTTPTLPDWLANRTSSMGAFASPSAPRATSAPSYSGAVPRRTMRGPFFPGSSNSVGPADPTTSSASESLGGRPSPSSESLPNNSFTGNQAPTSQAFVEGGNQVSDSGENTFEQGSEFSLEDLPPPPPPPNILPPSPPPDIQPSRDE